MTEAQQFDLNINGEVHSVRADGATTLLNVLRDQLGLTGAKCGCNQGLCGACNVLMDDQAVRSCARPDTAAYLEGVHFHIII